MRFIWGTPFGGHCETSGLRSQGWLKQNPLSTLRFEGSRIEQRALWYYFHTADIIQEDYRVEKSRSANFSTRSERGLFAPFFRFLSGFRTLSRADKCGRGQRAIGVLLLAAFD